MTRVSWAAWSGVSLGGWLESWLIDDLLLFIWRVYVCEDVGFWDYPYIV